MNQAPDKLKLKIISFKGYLKRHIYILALLISFFIIVIGSSIAWYNNRLVLKSPNSAVRYHLETSDPLRFLSNWDGPNYIYLSHYGYPTKRLTNFFPLYPITIHLVNYVIPSALISALLISWLSFSVAVYFFLKIIKHLFDINNLTSMIEAVSLFVFFPTAVFYLATYTESLFSALALGSIYFSLKRRYWLAMLMAMFLSATHITAVFVLALITLIAIEQKAGLKKIISLLVGGSLGLIGYMIFLQLKFHSALAFFHAQKKHGWLKGSYFHLFTTMDAFNFIFIILLIAAAFYWWPKRKSFSLYSLFFLTIPFIGRQFGGFNRYVLIAYPLPLMFYQICRRQRLVYNIILVLFVISWTYFLFQYAGGYIGG